MQSTKKANSIVTARMIDETTLGFTVIGFEELPFDLAKVSAKARAYAEIHGWGQRVPDKAAVSKTDKNDRIIPEAERRRMKYEGMKAVIAHYESGTEEWGMRSAGGPRAASTDHADTLAAIMVLHSMDHPAAFKFVTDKATTLNTTRTAVLDAFAALPKYAQQVMELRALRTAAIDETELLDGLPVVE